jgi:hypothetical protein
MNKKILASILVIGILALAMGYGTYSQFSGVQTGSGSFSTGTLTLDIASYSEWTVPNLSPGDEWNTSIVLTNTGSLDAKYVYMAFYITSDTGPGLYGLADKIKLIRTQDWCARDGWQTTTYDTAYSNAGLDYLYGWPTGTATKGYISLYDLANICMTGGASTTTSLQTRTIADDGVYLPAGYQCQIELDFKLLDDINNSYQGKTCSFTINFIATNAVGPAVDALS